MRMSREAILLSTMLSDMMPIRKRYMTHYDLSEYELIQQKKSNLSRAKRDGIIYSIEVGIKKGDLVRHEDGTVDFKVLNG